MDQDVLISIRDWYEVQLESLKGSPCHSKVRRCIYQRINEINMILFAYEEQETLRSLDALFLLDPTGRYSSGVQCVGEKPCESSYEDGLDPIFNLCNESKGIHD